MTEGTYIPDVSPFTPIWGQDASPAIVSYPELIAGFPCPDISIWPRTQVTSLVTQRIGSRNSGGSSHSTKKSRRRVASLAQRRAANIRERRRMYNLNEAFDKLRRKVPTFAYEKRLSRIETLRLAITYISFMTELLSGTPSNHHHHETGRRSPEIFGVHSHLHPPPIQRDFISPYNSHGI